MPHPLLGFGLSRQTALVHHLTSNHFPSVDLSWTDPAEAAIDAVLSHADLLDDGSVELDDYDFLTEPIEGCSKTIGEVMDGLHLWDFVTFALHADDDEGDEPKAGE